MASVRPGANGTVTSWPAFFAALLDGGAAAEHDQVGERHLLAAGWAPLKSGWIRSSFASTVGQLGRLVDLPVLLRREADPRAVGATALVGAAEAGGRRPRGGDQLRDGRPDARICSLSAAMSCVADQVVVDAGTGSCHSCGSGTHGPR